MYTFSELDLLETLEQTQGKNAKKTVLVSGKENPRFVELIDSALNFFKKYHIHKFNMPQPTNLEVDRHKAFMDVLYVLNKRQLTGDAAVGMVENFFGTCNPLQQKWYQRVLTKHLEVGVSDDTAITCGYPIPKFDVMLAKDGYNTKNVDRIVKKGVLVSRKLDGYRCIAIYDGIKVGLYSRNGTTFENFPQIEEELANRLHAAQTGPVVLDGEIMSDDFQAMQKSAFASKRGTTVGDVKYHVFTAVDYEDWLTSNFTDTAECRNNRLISLFRKAFSDSTMVERVDQILINDMDTLISLEEQYAEEGYEGLMAIPLDCAYYIGRKANKLMKFKRAMSSLENMQTMDCVVTSCYEGRRKNVGKLGGLTLKQENGISCNCGTGFHDHERETMWLNQDDVVGRICEIKYQNLTNDGKMRFPVFIRWRDNGAEFGKR